jgi:FixJ family two-component response regulator
MGVHGRNTPDQPGGTTSRSPVVAVIEDDSSFRRALTRLLGLRGFRTEAFASAEEFLRHRKPGSSYCIILDIHLGGMSGFELLAELAASDVSAPIIFITAFDDPATRQRALDAGAAGYLQKPFDEPALLEAIDQAMSRGTRGPGWPPVWP